MKSTHRHAATAVGLLALTLAGTPLLAQPQQRGGPPGPDTPILILATFHSTDHKLAVDATEDLRHRLMSEYSMKDLRVLTQKDINNTLEMSGYKADSALGASDLMELSKQLRGDETLDGTVSQTAAGVREEIRLLLRRNNTILSQPLPVITGKDVGDATKQAEKAYTEARKSLPAYKTCENDLRAQKYQDAEKDARLGLQAYPRSTLARLCLLTAFNQEKAPADSVISAANGILEIDPTSIIALNSAADAYRTKGDKDKAIEYNLRIYRADPSNVTIAQGIVNELAQSGAPDKALPIIDSLMKDNPGDPQMLHTKWLLQLRAGQAGTPGMYKAALATGEELMKIDTSVATIDFFNREIGAAQADSNTAAVQALAARAGQRFPAEMDFPLLLAQSYLKQGQLQQALAAARQAAKVNPKSAKPVLFVIAVQNQLGQSDSALVTAQQAIAGGVAKDSLAGSLLAAIGPALKKAQETKARADWATVLQSAQAVDAIASSPNTKFYIGVSSFSIATDALTNVQEATKKTKKEDREKGCDELKVVEDMFNTASAAMPAGGKIDPAAAGQIMSAIGQYSPYIPQFKTALKCK